MDLLGLVTKATKVALDVSGVSIDNWSFKLYYKVTAGLIVLCSFLVSGRQFFGNPIHCDAGSNGGSVKDDVLESYCWMYAHFKIPMEYQGPCSGKDQENIEGPVYNSYYQWVPIFLMFTAFMFYIPRCMWLTMEGGLMKFFGKGTTTRLIEEPEEKKQKLVQFFSENIHNKYNIYYFGFIVCEISNTLMVIIVGIITHVFLNYQFLGYGFRTWMYYRLPPEEQKMVGRTNPMCETFPRIASCDYHRFGTGGKPEKINALCILALNIINDKVFLVLWWWYLILIFVGTCRIIFRLIQINSTRFRFYLLKIRMNRYFKRNANMDKVRTYICQCSRGDWFVLYQLSKNLNRPFFMEFLIELARTLDPKSPHKDVDEPDGIMDMMLQPALQTYESTDCPKAKAETDEEED